MSKLAALIGIAFIVLAIALRGFYLQRAQIVLDEFQHLHAAYLVSEGQTPYVDFFAHHTPLFYYIAAPLLWASSLDFDTILSARNLSLAASALTLLLASWWACRLRGPGAGMVVAVLMAGNFFLFSRGTVLFLDVFSSLLLMLSAFALAESRGRLRMVFLAGLAMGLAVLLTQKAVMAGFAPLLFFVAGILRRDDANAGRWFARLGVFVAGGAAAGLLLPVLLGFGGLRDFLQDTVLMNLAWKARYLSVRDLVLLAVTDGAIYLAALVGAVACCRDILRRRLRLAPDDMPVLFLASLSLGVVLLPVVWTEYFVPLVNFAVLVAGLFIVDFCSTCLMDDAGQPRIAARRHKRTILLIVVVGLVAVVDLVGRRMAQAHTMSNAGVATVVVLWAAIGFSLGFAIRNRSRAWPSLALALLLAFPVVEQLDYFRQASNGWQRARVEFVQANTRPDECVFDGFSGYGVFRPHAYRYWFLHEEVQMMLSEAELGPDVIEVLERTQTPLVVCDQYTDALPAAVHRYIARNYQSTNFPDIRARRGKD